MKNFLENPFKIQEDYLKKFGLIKSRTEVYRYFNEKYFRPQPSDASKIILAFKDFHIGKIYTFSYNNPIYKDVLEFYDAKPIILVLSSEYNKNTKHHIITGINLNFIPYEIKKNVIQIIWTKFEKLIEMDFNKQKKGKLGPFEPIFKPNYDYYGLLVYLLENIAKSNFKFAVRRYWWRKIYLPMNIEYEDWSLIPFIDSKDAVGLTIENIYNLYWRDKIKK